MTIILNILKVFVAIVYAFFLLDAVLNIRYEMFDKEGREKDPLSWLDMVYLSYALFNFVLVIKFLYRA